MKRLQRDRYLDLDRRIARLSGLAPATPAAPSAPVAETPTIATPAAGNEREAYEAAFGLTRDKRFAEAIPAFEAFIEAYPPGPTFPMPGTGLGTSAWPCQSRFGSLSAGLRAGGFPVARHPKVPDALYKLGVVYDQLGVQSDATRYFQRVLAELLCFTACGR